MRQILVLCTRAPPRMQVISTTCRQDQMSRCAFGVPVDSGKYCYHAVSEQTRILHSSFRNLRNGIHRAGASFRKVCLPGRRRRSHQSGLAIGHLHRPLIDLCNADPFRRRAVRSLPSRDPRARRPGGLHFERPALPISASVSIVILRRLIPAGRLADEVQPIKTV